MPTKCVIAGCATKQGDKVPMFSFPNWFSDNGRREQWLKNIGLKESEVTSTSRVCWKHFEDKFIIRGVNSPNRLKPDALPTRALGVPYVVSQEGKVATAGEMGLSTSKETSPLPIIVNIDDTVPLQSPERTVTTISTPASAYSSGSAYVPSLDKKFRMKPIMGSYRMPTADAAYIVLEENLRGLFKRCQECGGKLDQLVRFHVQGGHLRVETFCAGCVKEIDWQSSPCVNKMSLINLLVPAATITAGKTFEDLQQIASGCKLAVPSKTEYNDAARAYVYPAVRTLCNEANEELLRDISTSQAGANDLRIAMDTRFSSPGHTATFATTSAMDLSSKKVISTVVTVKRTDAPSSFLDAFRKMPHIPLMPYVGIFLAHHFDN